MTLHRSAFKRWLATPRLWWRAKGFGVHSPSAYDYVRGVVNERCHYYAYERVDELARGAGLSRHTARLLMRVALREGSAEIECHGVRPQVCEIVTSWSSDAVVTERPGTECSMVVVGCQEMDEKRVFSSVERVMSGGGSVVLLDVNRRCGGSNAIFEGWLGECSRCGVLMTDGKTAVLHVVPGVPGQYYEMRL